MTSYPSLLSVIVTILACPIGSYAAACSNFTASTTNSSTTTFSYPGPTIVVSRVETCPATQNCTLRAGGIYNAERNLNITLDEDTTNSIFNLIEDKTSVSSIKSVTNLVDGASYYLHNQTGYIYYQAGQKCVAGTLTGCSATGLSETTAIQACTPVILDNCKAGNGKYDCVVGAISFAELNNTSESAGIECTACDAYDKEEAKSAGTQLDPRGLWFLLVVMSLGMGVVML